jgi:hypothetical protein
MESRWTSKISESNLRGQNSMACGVLYIIGKLLERRCLKWARIAHLHISNTSYGQKKGRESNCQYDSWLEKVGNRPDLFGCRQHATYRWKPLNENYNFASNYTSEVCSQSYGAPKSQESRLVGFWDSNSGVPWEKSHLDVGPVERSRIYYKGEVVASPKSGPWWVLCVRVACGSS